MAQPGQLALVSPCAPADDGDGPGVEELEALASQGSTQNLTSYCPADTEAASSPHPYWQRATSELLRSHVPKPDVLRATGAARAGTAREILSIHAKCSWVSRPCEEQGLTLRTNPKLLWDMQRVKAHGG